MKTGIILAALLLSAAAFGEPDRGAEERQYRRAADMLQKKQLDAAARTYGELAAGGGSKFDAASYWQAYTLHKLGRGEEALKALALLYSKAPQSRWLNDAKALEMEIRQSAGQSVSPEGISDEELKLMAVATLMQSDPARAVPLLEKVIFGKGSVRVKEVGVMVLAQKKTPESQAILTRLAKGEGNPDLQMRSLEALGMQGGQENIALLGSIYTAVNDVEVRRRVLHGFGMAKANDQLLNVARTESEPSLRRDAIHMLAMSGAPPDALRALYDSEKDETLRRDIIGVLAMRRASREVLEIARREKSPKLKIAAIEALRMSDPKAADEFAAEVLLK